MPYAELIGEHESIKAVRALIARIAQSPVRQVLIYGETGTGKGLVARLIHRLSPRANHPFVDVNCAAIPATLMESELFGHERGAFTGAQGAKPGLIEAAQGGTLFLDEIREMDLQLQAKLLTLLDTHEFRRLGAIKPTRVDVRFIASTNRILLAEVKAGRFRDDLYWRLQVVAVNIPPLRERGDDVLLLAEAFLREHGARAGRVIRGLEPRVAEIFQRYSWPGNVRELENLIERIAILEREDLVLVRHLPDRILREVEGRSPAAAGGVDDAAAALEKGFYPATEAFQRALIAEALKRAGGRHGRAARLLRLSRHALRHQMLKLGLATTENAR
ncbi:MAG: sigma 54-interacting transcriptional regulator [Elioraea sp.]|nr:sigma 54-interacting transcriptional regulator [Elioraea sp.]